MTASVGLALFISPFPDEWRMSMTVLAAKMIEHDISAEDAQECYSQKFTGQLLIYSSLLRICRQISTSYQLGKCNAGVNNVFDNILFLLNHLFLWSTKTVCCLDRESFTLLICMWGWSGEFALSGSCMNFRHFPTHRAVSALNGLKATWNSPSELQSWFGDPCTDKWLGVTCNGLQPYEIVISL